MAREDTAWRELSLLLPPIGDRPNAIVAAVAGERLLASENRTGTVAVEGAIRRLGKVDMRVVEIARLRTCSGQREGKTARALGRCPRTRRGRQPARVLLRREPGD